MFQLPYTLVTNTYVSIPSIGQDVIQAAFHKSLLSQLLSTKEVFSGNCIPCLNAWKALCWPQQSPLYISQFDGKHYNNFHFGFIKHYLLLFQECLTDRLFSLYKE